VDFIQTLDSIDKQWLLALNNDYSSFWDTLMFLISAKLTWIPFYAAMLFVVIKHWRKEAWWIVLALVLCVLFSDQIASGIIKNLVQRPRPSHDPEIQSMVCLVNDYRGGQFGFVSSHAANTFGLALLSSLLFKTRKYTIPAFTWAVIVTYSRIYLGVHYPGDVLGGAMVGIVVALLIFWVLKKIRPQLLSACNPSEIQIKIPVWTLFVISVILVIYSAVVG